MKRTWQLVLLDCTRRGERIIHATFAILTSATTPTSLKKDLKGRSTNSSRFLRKVFTCTLNHTLIAFLQLLAQYSGPGKKMPKSISKQYSLHPEPNPILDLPGFNATKNPSCRMHACDHGVFKRLLDMILELVGKQRAEIKRTFDER
jgi:hypothetical protein